jgi:hypothetical protein
MTRAFLALLFICFCITANAQPLITPDALVMKLDDIGLYAVGYAYRGQKETAFPVGWSGDFDDRTGIACRPAGEQNGRRAFLLHCPWRGGTGITYQEFRFALPKARRIFLRGATAMRADIVGRSDGATFRVYANGRKLLDVNQADSTWKPFRFDLTPYAGKTLTLRFETDPGPKDNPGFDFSLWGDRELVLEGFAPLVVKHPAPPPLPLPALWPVQKNGAIPQGAFAYQVRMNIEKDAAVFRYSGVDGALEYRWQKPRTPEEGLFGRITLRAQMKGDRPVQIPLATSAKLEWAQPAQPQEDRWINSSRGLILMRTFRIGNETAKAQIIGYLTGKSLVFDITCDRPGVAMLDVGGWGPTLRRRQVTVPYYSGQVYYLPAENLFVNAALDWTASSASWQENARAHYGALTDGTRIPLKERVLYTAAWHMAEVLPNIPNPPSPFLKDIAGRVVLDIWGGRYTDIAKGFEQLHDYGVTDCIALIHDWQRSGYDNALPAHIPAASDKGGDEGMKTLVSTGVRLGYRVALHENYVDYYPNYDFFDPNDTALDSAGNRQNAWYNPGTKIQSFAEKPNAILRLAATQSPEIHRRYGTNADYLDVHSAVPPWFHVDFRAGEEGAGTFRRVWDVHRELWQYERQTHGGPVFGEGANHWYWSGCLDGVEAQFGVGWPGGGGLSAPLAVDFDLLKIHPLQFNHGMGYYERWWSDAKWGSRPPMIVLDQYRMQEIAYGHAGFLAGSTWNVLPLAWLEHHLMAPVTARYAAAKPVKILYEMNGRWVDGTEAAKAGAWRRVRVQYDNGLTITANDAAEPLRVGERVLPRFGWLAQGAGVTAWTALQDGVVADLADTGDTLFASARSAADWNMTGIRRIRPQVAVFGQTGPRAFQAAYRWTVNDTLPEDFTCFVHFSRPGVDPYDEGIKFQNDHALPKPTSDWQPGETVMDGPYIIRIPDDLPDGDYQWSIGLFTPASGRVTMEGETDTHGRILLGVVGVRDNGATITFEPEKRAGGERLKLYTAHLNQEGKVVNFGAARTNGSFRVRRESGEWVLQTLPREKEFTLELSAQRFGRPAKVRCVEPVPAKAGSGEETVVPEPRSGGFWRLPLNGAKEYHWPAK